jgi:hypothetical protein
MTRKWVRANKKNVSADCFSLINYSCFVNERRKIDVWSLNLVIKFWFLFYVIFLFFTPYKDSYLLSRLLSFSLLFFIEFRTHNMLICCRMKIDESCDLEKYYMRAFLTQFFLKFFTCLSRTFLRSSHVIERIRTKEFLWKKSMKCESFKT